MKRNLQRTIARVALPGGAVYVKWCRANTPRAFLRELLRPPKSQLEFENAVRLRDLGVPCVEPLAWGRVDTLWPGDNALVTREQAGAVPLDTFLTHAHPSRTLRDLARELGRLFANLHDAGVTHPDPHAGNLLVEHATGGPPLLTLLDVHDVRFGPPLPWADARDNLALFNRWFQVRANRADRARFWHAYASARRMSEPLGAAHAAELEAATAESNLRFWAGRTARYFGNNRQSRTVKGRGVRGFAVRDLPDEVLTSWLADPDAPFREPGVKLIKDSPSSTVAELTIRTPTGPRAIIYKRFRIKTPIVAVKNILRRSAALRSWEFGHSLLDRQLPTARPLTAFHRFRLGMPSEGYVAFEKVENAIELSATRPTKALAVTLGKLVRRMHDRQVAHRDLKAANVLLAGPAAEPVLIDLVGLTVGKPVPEADRVQNLARLNASFLHSPHVSRSLRRTFLRAYLGTRTPDRNAWKRWWKTVTAATAAKVLKNLHSGRPLA